MKNYLTTHKKLFSAIVAVVFALLITLFNSSFLSPLFIGYPYGSLNQDSQFFFYAAKLLVQGQTPYIDFFDHKGLYHIYIDALGVLMGGKTALFFIEALFVGVGAYFGIESIRIIKEDNRTGFIFLGFMAGALTLARQSNGEGVWLLPFVSLIFYFYLLGKTKKDYFYLLSGIAIGVEMGLALNSRASDGIVGGIFAIFYIVELIKNKKIKLLLGTAGCAIGALAIVLAAFYIPAYFMGYAKEMFESAIIHNFFYISKTPLDADKIISKGVAGLFLVISVLMTIYIYKKHLKDKFSFMFCFTSIGVMTLEVVIGHYLAYFQSISIFMSFFMTYFATKLFVEGKKEVVKTCGCSALGILSVSIMLIVDFIFCYGPANNIFSYKEEQILSNNVQLVINETKAEKGESYEPLIYAVDMTTSIYLEGNINTHNNIFANQSWWSYAKPSIKDTVGDKLNEGYYDYIFMGNGVCKEYFLERMNGVYTPHTPEGYIQTSEYTLYKKM